MIFQDSQSSLNPTKTIGEQVAEPVRLHRGASRKEALDRALEVLELVGLPQAAGAPGRLSAPALGRAAAARDDRDRARLRAEGAARRRADDRARRHDPGADPARCSTTSRTASGWRRCSSRTTWASSPGRHQPDQRHVRRADRRDGRDPGALQRACAIPTPRRCSARSRGSIRTTRKAAGQHPRTAARPHEPAGRAAGLRRAARCATDQCRAEEPPLTGDDPEHLFACWHPVDGPVEATRRCSSQRTAPRRPRNEHRRPPARDRERRPRVPGDRGRDPAAQGQLGQGRLRRDRCTSTPARRSAWSASRAAARPRSAS